MNIVSLLPSATEIIADLGLGDHLVGITHSCDYPPEISGLPRVTSTEIPKEASSREIDDAVRDAVRSERPLYEIDVELLERLQPDVLITQGVCDVCAVCESQALATLPALSRQPTVVNLTPHRLDDVLQDVSRIGAAVGQTRRADEVVATCRARIAAVRRRVGSFAPRSVVVLEWVDPLFSSGHWTPEVVSLAGGRELLSEPGARSRELRWEEIVGADPEVLLVAGCGLDEQRNLDDLGTLRGLPGFDRLRCSQNGDVYVTDGGAYFNRPSLRLIDALEMLAATLHPAGESGFRRVP